MKIKEKRVKIKDLVKGYETNSVTNSVSSMDGALNIRPDYQREFVYNDKKQSAVISSILKGFPLNTMYWNKIGEGKWEVMDGQQRTISICKFVQGDFSVDSKGLYYAGLNEEQRKAFDEYELIIYECEGTTDEVLDWFRVINIAGVPLNNQELLNATFHGKWISSAKEYFSKPNNAASDVGEYYISGTVNRQDLLAQAIEWNAIIDGDKSVEEFMGKHQKDNDAVPLWDNFKKVIKWAKSLFDPHPKITDHQNWGQLYADYGTDKFDKDELNKKLDDLLKNEDIQKPVGIIPYILTGQESYLNLRQFKNSDMIKKYDEQKGICPVCKKRFEFNEMEGDHIIPWSQGGSTTYDNLQMLYMHDNRTKSDK